MKRLIALCLLTLPSLMQAQYSDNYFEAGLGIGTSSYSGELTSSIFDTKHIHLAGGIFARYNIGKWVGLKAHFDYAHISGDDANSSNERNRLRNLHFRSNIFEFGVHGEFNLMGYHPRALEHIFSPYVFVGINALMFEPQAQHFDPLRDGEWVNLREIGTEGQGLNEFPNRTAYNTTQVAIPLGVGIKIALNSHWNLGFEVGARKTFTDYLDDVSLTYAYYTDASGTVQNAYANNYPNYVAPDGTVYGRSEAELFADRTSELYADGNVPAQDLETRGAVQRGDDNSTDWYLITQLSISYNFIDNGLVGSRKRRRRRQGCRSAIF